MKKLSTILAVLAVVATIFVMTACTPSSSADMKKRYEENGYKVAVVISENDNNETISWQITAAPEADSVAGALGSIGKLVTATCYKTEESAQKAYDALEGVDADKKFINGKVVVSGFSAESVNIAK